MTAKALTLTRLIIDCVWALATGWKLPGLNFNFATWVLGIIIIGVMLAMFGDFLVHFGVKPLDTSYMSFEEYFAASDKWYKDELKGYYDRRK